MVRLIALNRAETSYRSYHQMRSPVSSLRGPVVYTDVCTRVAQRRWGCPADTSRPCETVLVCAVQRGKHGGLSGLQRRDRAAARRFGPNPKPDFSGDFQPASREIKQERRST